MGLKELFRLPFKKKLAEIFSGGGRSHDERITELEELLILSDLSVDLSQRIVAGVRRTCRSGFRQEDYLHSLRNELMRLFTDLPRQPLAVAGAKEVILLVGVNGSGKTTVAAKLAYAFQSQGRRVLLAAADTFRAAGSTQLSLWGEKLGIPVVGGDLGADPGSVVFNSLQSFLGRDYDRLIVDTAGRMQSKEHLLLELEKLVKIIKKFLSQQPAEVLLTLDAATGQNALVQAEKFRQFSGLTGIILTKLDGTARGGTVLNIVDQLKLPVRYLGSGESERDLVEFSAADFVAALVAS